MIVLWMVEQGQQNARQAEEESAYIRRASSPEEVEKCVLHQRFEALVVITSKPRLSDAQWLSSLITVIPIYLFTEVDKHTQFIVTFILYYLSSIRDERAELDFGRRPASPGDEVDWQKSLQFIRDNLYNNDLSLEDVAMQSYMSKWHFSKIFKRKFGITFREFLIQERIELAKKLLLANISVTNVCYEVGYGDLTHFGRIFQKKVGLTPSRFKKQYGIAHEHERRNG